MQNLKSRIISSYFGQFLLKNLLKTVAESMRWATCLFFLKIASEGFNLQLWRVVDCFAVAFFYWILLSANLLTQTLFELKMVASGNKLSNSLVNLDPR